MSSFAEINEKEVFEKEQLSDILNSIREDKFNELAFKETLFSHLKLREGKIIIETLLQAGARTQTSDIIDNEQMRIRNTHLHIVKLLANTAENCDFYVTGDYYTKIDFHNYRDPNHNRDLCTNKEKPVLHYAARYGWIGIVQSLLQEGADLNAKGDDGKTPLLEATENQHRDIVDLLVNSGADVFCRTKMNYTLLHAASAAGWIDFVQFLLQKGVNPNEDDTLGMTPLHYAASVLRRDIVALLIDSGADTTCGYLQGSVLHFAVMFSSLEVVKCLVENGADISNTCFRGFMPLNVACKKQKIEVIEYLINDINIRYGINETPLKFIMRYHPKLKLIKTFVERYGYLSNFIDDYYGEDKRNLTLKSDVFQNVQICTQAIISKFNNMDLPTLYSLPLPVGTLPPIQNLMITNQEIIQDIEQSVRYEINTSEHCDLRRPKVILLSMLCVKSYIDHYNIPREKVQLKRSATANSGEPSQSCSKLQRLE